MMPRLSVALWGLVVILLGLISWLYASRPAPPLPPLPRVDLVEAMTASQLKVQRQTCSSAEDYQRLAGQYFAYGFFPEAVVCYEVACSMAPGDAETRRQLAFCLSHAGRVKESNQRYREAIELGANKSDVSYFIGRNLLRLEQVEQAKAAFQTAKDLPAARLEYEKLAYRAGAASSADSQLARLRQAYPRTTAILYLSEKWARRQGRDDQAAKFRDEVNRATGRLPSPFSAESERVVKAYESTGLARRRAAAGKLRDAEYESAESASRQILKQRFIPDEMNYLADLALLRGQIASSIEMMHQIIEKDGPSLDRNWRLGDAYARANEPEKAEKAWLTAVRLGQGKNRDLAELHDNLSKFFDSLGRASEANKHQARSKFHAGLDAFYALEFASARSLLQASVLLNSEDPQSWFYYGEAQRLSDDSIEAESAYQRCLQLAPHHGRALAALQLLKAAGP